MLLPGVQVGDRITLQGTIWGCDLDLTIRGTYKGHGIDETIVFHALTEDHLKQIVGIQLGRLRQRLAVRDHLDHAFRR